MSYTLAANIQNLTLNNSNIAGTGNNLNDYLTTNYNNDTLIGGLANDTIDDNGYQTVMTCGTGNDTYIIRNSNSVIVGNPVGTVELYVSYTLGSNLNNVTLEGINDLTVQGNSLNDIITANSGNDVIYSGSGLDTMIGGTGNDTYYVNNTGDVIIENSNTSNDTVISTVSYTLPQI